MVVCDNESTRDAHVSVYLHEGLSFQNGGVVQQDVEVCGSKDNMMSSVESHVCGSSQIGESGEEVCDSGQLDGAKETEIGEQTLSISSEVEARCDNGAMLTEEQRVDPYEERSRSAQHTGGSGDAGDMTEAAANVDLSVDAGEDSDYTGDTTISVSDWDEWIDAEAASNERDDGTLSVSDMDPIIGVQEEVVGDGCVAEEPGSNTHDTDVGTLDDGSEDVVCESGLDTLLEVHNRNEVLGSHPGEVLSEVGAGETSGILDDSVKSRVIGAEIGNDTLRTEVDVCSGDDLMSEAVTNGAGSTLEMRQEAQDMQQGSFDTVVAEHVVAAVAVDESDVGKCGGAAGDLSVSEKVSGDVETLRKEPTAKTGHTVSGEMFDDEWWELERMYALTKPERKSDHVTGAEGAVAKDGASAEVDGTRYGGHVSDKRAVLGLDTYGKPVVSTIGLSIRFFV